MPSRQVKKKAEKYWICQECAKQKNLTTKYPDGGNTVISGLCGWCKRRDVTMLTPLCDYKKIGDNYKIAH